MEVGDNLESRPPTGDSVPKGYVTVDQASVTSGLTPRYISTLLQHGRIIGHLEADRWVITRFSLDAYLMNRRARGRPKKRL